MRSFSHTYFFVLLRCTQNHVAELELGRVHVLSPHKLIFPTRYSTNLPVGRLAAPPTRHNTCFIV